jgi:hypothetical protein
MQGPVAMHRKGEHAQRIVFVKRIKSNPLPYRLPKRLTSSVLQSVRDSRTVTTTFGQGRDVESLRKRRQHY